METKEILKKIKAYLRKKDIEKTKKDNEIKVSKIVVSIFQDKTPKQSIQMMKDIQKLFDERLDENLRESLESVKEISNYKKIEL